MIPIPKKMLPNSVTYEEYKEDMGEGSYFLSPVTLDYVKIEEQQQLVYNPNGVELVGNAMLFYDLTNSTGLTKEPVNESKITFNGKVYHIVDTDILRGNSNKPHHYEIKLK